MQTQTGFPLCIGLPVARTCIYNQHGSSIRPSFTRRTSHWMRADNWRKLICMHNGAGIYLNLISFPHCRLLCQSHINPLISWYAAHDVAHAWWIFISELPFPPPSPPQSCLHRARPASRRTLALFSPPSSRAQPRAVWLLPVSAWLAPLTRMAHKSELPSRDHALRGRHEAMVVAGKRTHVQRIALTSTAGGKARANATSKRRNVPAMK